MFRRISIISTVTLLLLLASTAVLADDLGFPWKAHAAPFNYEFGNLIDNHQQSKLVRRGMLQGFIYIQFTGAYVDGVPVAERADCENPELDCRVGWKVKGIPFKATLVSKGPRKWLVDPSLLQRKSKYVHFHWEGTPKKPCGLVVGQEYEGFLLQRTAVTEFHWLGGNSSNGHGGHLVTLGKDLHSNIVTEWDGDPGSGGDPGGGGDHDDGGCGGHDDGGSGGHDDGGSGGHDDGGSGGPGGSGGGHDDGSEGGCSGHEDGEDEGCSGHDGGISGQVELADLANTTTKTAVIDRLRQ